MPSGLAGRFRHLLYPESSLLNPLGGLSSLYFFPIPDSSKDDPEGRGVVSLPVPGTCYRVTEAAVFQGVNV